MTEAIFKEIYLIYTLAFFLSPHLCFGELSSRPPFVYMFFFFNEILVIIMCQFDSLLLPN